MKSGKKNFYVLLFYSNDIPCQNDEGSESEMQEIDGDLASIRTKLQKAYNKESVIVVSKTYWIFNLVIVVFIGSIQYAHQFIHLIYYVSLLVVAVACGNIFVHVD